MPRRLSSNLYQGQPIDEQGDVIAVLVGAFNRDLVGDLILILTPLFGVQKLQVTDCAIIAAELEAVA